MCPQAGAWEGCEGTGWQLHLLGGQKIPRFISQCDYDDTFLKTVLSSPWKQPKGKQHVFLNQTESLCLENISTGHALLAGR